MTKRKSVAVALLMAGILLVSGVLTLFTGVSHTPPAEGVQMVASFYPVYIAALNVTEGAAGVTLTSLTSPGVGCLHDYQLTTQNWISLNGADVLLLSGAGAEGFLDNFWDALGHLQMVDTSAGVECLPATGHHHDHGDHDHECVYNEHIWTSPALYSRQVQTMCDRLCEIDPANADVYRRNTARYRAEIGEIETALTAVADKLTGVDGLLFHDSLAYLAADLRLPVVATLPIGEEATLSAAELAEAEQAIRPDRGLWLLYDNQYPVLYTDVGKAVPHRVLTLDTAVRGEPTKDAWLTAMRQNLATLTAGLEDVV